VQLLLWFEVHLRLGILEGIVVWKMHQLVQLLINRKYNVMDHLSMRKTSLSGLNQAQTAELAY
jgi:hypothetical protein